MPVEMHFISSSWKSSYMHLLLQNGDFLLMSLPKTLKNRPKKKASKKTSHIKFKTKGNKLSVGRLVHTLLKSCSFWSLSELFNAIKHGQIFFTGDENLAFYFFGKSVLVFALSHQGVSRTALCYKKISNIFLWCGPMGPDDVLSCSVFSSCKCLKNTALRERRCATGIAPAWTVSKKHKAAGNSAVLFS